MPSRALALVLVSLPLSACRLNYDQIALGVGQDAEGKTTTGATGGTLGGGGTGNTTGGGTFAGGGGDNTGGGGGTSGGGGTGGSAAGAGGCVPTNGGVEVCDGLDNDCSGADDGVTCPPGCRGVAYASAGYQFCEPVVDWPTAQGACTTQGMHLVKVSSAMENTFIAQTAFGTGASFLWLGGDDLTTEGSWHWQDGTLFWTGSSSGSAPVGAYTNWYTGFPATGTNTDCLEMRDDATWDDKQCSQGKRYVCQSN